LYERLFAEALLYFYRNRDRFEDWQIVIIYPSRSKEQTKTRPYRAFLASEQVHRIYLDELGELEQLPLKLGLLVLTTLDQNQAPAAARYLINRSQQEISEPTATRAIMEIITSIISYRFTSLSPKEIETMLDISFEQTRLYQDLKQQAEEQGLEQGRQEEAIKLVLRILAKKFREVPTQLTIQIEGLSLQNLEALADALLDFASLDDLVSWLQRLARIKTK